MAAALAADPGASPPGGNVQGDNLSTSLCLLAGPDDEEEVEKKAVAAKSGAKQFDPIKHLEQWRVICIDFHRFRGKCPDKCKVLIRQGIPEFLRGSVWQKLALSRKLLQLSRDLLEKHPKDLYEQMKGAQTAPCE